MAARVHFAPRHVVMAVVAVTLAVVVIAQSMQDGGDGAVSRPIDGPPSGRSSGEGEVLDAYPLLEWASGAKAYRVIDVRDVGDDGLIRMELAEPQHGGRVVVALLGIYVPVEAREAENSDGDGALPAGPRTTAREFVDEHAPPDSTLWIIVAAPTGETVRDYDGRWALAFLDDSGDRGAMLNGALLAAGLARVDDDAIARFAAAHPYLGTMRISQDEAREAGLGAWASEPSEDDPPLRD